MHHTAIPFFTGERDRNPIFREGLLAGGLQEFREGWCILSLALP